MFLWLVCWCIWLLNVFLIFPLKYINIIGTPILTRLPTINQYWTFAIFVRGSLGVGLFLLPQRSFRLITILIMVFLNSTLYNILNIPSVSSPVWYMWSPFLVYPFFCHTLHYENIDLSQYLIYLITVNPIFTGVNTNLLCNSENPKFP